MKRIEENNSCVMFNVEIVARGYITHIKIDRIMYFVFERNEHNEIELDVENTHEFLMFVYEQLDDENCDDVELECRSLLVKVAENLSKHQMTTTQDAIEHNS